MRHLCYLLGCMRKISKVTVAIVASILLVQVGAVSAEYYVDYDNGHDERSGHSPGEAFQHAPGDSNATFNAAMVDLQPGDTVNFAGGVRYSGTIEVSWSGTADSPIRFLGGAAAGWGPERAIIDGEQIRYNSIYISDQAFIEIGGFELANNAATQDLSLQGFIRGRDVHDIVIRDCLIRFTEGWSIIPEFDPNQEQEEAHQAGIYITTWDGPQSRNVIIEDTEIYAIGHVGIVFNRVHDSVIRRTNIGGIARGADAGYFLAAISVRGDCERIRIQDNEIHDGWQYEGDIEEGQIAHGHDWIHIYRTHQGHGDDIVVERNLFYIDYDFQYTRGGSFGYCEDATDVIYRNNIYLNPHGAAGFIGLKQNSSGQIYNNLFVSYDRPGYNSACITFLADAGHWEVFNNIFVTFGPAPVVSSAHSPPPGFLMRNNRYFSFDSEDPRSVKYIRMGPNTQSSYFTLSEWQALGYDRASQVADPMLDFIPTTGGASSLGNYRPTEASVALIDRGFSPSGVDSILDFFGNMRDRAWDIGPIEYGSQPSAHESAPSGLRVRSGAD